MTQTLICREMKWTYEEYVAQPAWFVQSILSLIIEEARHAARNTS